MNIATEFIKIGQPHERVEVPNIFKAETQPEEMLEERDIQGTERHEYEKIKKYLTDGQKIVLDDKEYQNATQKELTATAKYFEYMNSKTIPGFAKGFINEFSKTSGYDIYQKVKMFRLYRIVQNIAVFVGIPAGAVGTAVAGIVLIVTLLITLTHERGEKEIEQLLDEFSKVKQ